MRGCTLKMRQLNVRSGSGVGGDRRAPRNILFKWCHLHRAIGAHDTRTESRMGLDTASTPSSQAAREDDSCRAGQIGHVRVGRVEPTALLCDDAPVRSGPCDNQWWWPACMSVSVSPTMNEIVEIHRAPRVASSSIPGPVFCTRSALSGRGPSRQGGAGTIAICREPGPVRRGGRQLASAPRGSVHRTHPFAAAG